MTQGLSGFTLVNVVHTAVLYGAATSCFKHAELMRPHFKGVQVVLSDDGPLANMCCEKGLPVTVFPFRHRGLRKPSCSLRLARDLVAVAGSRARYVKGLITQLGKGLELLHVHSSEASYALLAGWWAGVPTVAHIRESRKPGLEGWWKEWVMARCATRIVAVSRGILCGYGSTVRNKARIIHNCMDLVPLRSEESQRSVPIVGFVGNIQTTKGYKEFLRICANLRDAGVIFRARMVGNMIDSDVKGWCERFMAEQALDNLVEWSPWQLDVGAVYRGIDVMVLPTHDDALPRAIMEAMSYGLPVVTSDVGGLPEMVEHETTGFLAPYTDVGKLTGYVRVLLQDAALRKRMGEAATQRARQLFSREVYENKMVELYRDVCAGQGQAIMS